MRDNDSRADFDDGLRDESPATDWTEYYYGIRERLWILILCAILGGIGGAVYQNLQHPLFRARAVLVFEPTQPKVLEKVQGIVGEETSASPEVINTIVDLLQSYPFAQRVAERLELQRDPRFLADPAVKELLPMSVDNAAGILLRDVTAGYRPRTRLIDIQTSFPSASLATEVANAYVDEYIGYNLERRASANKAANQYLLDEADRLRREMRVSEEAMQSFREREGAASPEKLQQSSEGKLDGLSSGITEAENKIFQLDNDLKVASSAPGDIETLLRLPSIAAEPRVAAANEALAEQQRQFALLQQRYRAKHPLYIATQTQIESLEKSRDQLLQDSVNLLRGVRQRLQAQKDELSKAQQDQQRLLLSVTGQSVEYNDLKRKLETSTAMYNAVLSRVAEIDVTKDMTELPVRVHERALGAGAVSSSPVKVYAIALLSGLAVGFGAALALHTLDRSIKTIDQAEGLAGIPVMSAVPKNPTGSVAGLETVTARKGLVAEAFRSLRTSLAMGTGAQRRTFLITSAMPGEGKTFCSSNFAATLGQQGFKTLVIDADLRKPRISQVFFGKNRRPGLTEVLTGKVPLGEAIIASEVENVSVLAAGSEIANPTELLASQRWHEVLQEALGVYDRVVIDSAPLLVVSDSLLIAPHTDVICLVIRSFKTPNKTVKRALKALSEIKCQPAGLVLNFMASGAGTYYYYSGKAYGTKEYRSYGDKFAEAG